jgi:hypothetical protein
VKIVTFLIFTVVPLPAAVITQWNFNSIVNDASITTGTLSPSVGTGTASLLTNTGTFANGSINGGSSDTNTTDNSGWGTLNYPTLTVGNLTAGVQFLANTTGYTNLTLNYDIRHSNTSSRHEAVQYTTNGTTWNTTAFFAASLGDTWFNSRFIDLSAIPLVENNPNFGVRIVSAFESTATGGGAVSYVATAPDVTYATIGTWRFDMVTVSGTLIPEPSSGMLGLVAILGLLHRRRIQ